MHSPRVPLVEPGTRPDLAQVEDAIRGARGRISPLYQALLNSPPIAAGWEQLLTAVRNLTLVPPALRELAILRVAVLNRAAFEFDAHVPHASKAGIPQSKIDALRGLACGARADAPFDADDDLVIALTDAMTRDIEVPDALFERVRARFDDRTAVEVVTTIAAYNMVSRFLVALHIGHNA
ncbi:MAG: carboxymuconolactone decarboxylase family protein [Burkholderiales bacterium]